MLEFPVNAGYKHTHPQSIDYWGYPGHSQASCWSQYIFMVHCQAFTSIQVIGIHSPSWHQERLQCMVQYILGVNTYSWSITRHSQASWLEYQIFASVLVTTHIFLVPSWAFARILVVRKPIASTFLSIHKYPAVHSQAFESMPVKKGHITNTFLSLCKDASDSSWSFACILAIFAFLFVLISPSDDEVHRWSIPEHLQPYRW